MKFNLKKYTQYMDSMVLTGVGLAAVYWICESFMFFFLEPEANFIQHLIGEDTFQTWTRLLVLCLFVIFGSHYQYMFNKNRLADEALRDSEEKYRNILESIEEGYFETDLEGCITFVSDPLCKILGYPRDMLVGMNTSAYTTSETAAKMVPILKEVMQTGKPVNVLDYNVTRQGGENKTLEMSFAAIRDPEGKANGFRGVLRDVTARKQAEEEKKKLESQLQQAQKMESIGTLAGGIAHDFNNILMGIQGNASLLHLKVEDDHPGYEKIKNIEKYVENGTELTRQLLGFARRGKYQVKATDLNEVLEKSSALFGRTKKEIQIHYKLADGLWTVEIDRGQIEQALLNLYVNAWQAMNDGGDLFLQTENAFLDQTYVQPYKVHLGRYVKISISDTGVGIDKKTQERIFEPFFTTKEMGRGTGLGLASVYGIIKNHGGYINVYSEIDKGTTFTFYLPASQKEVVEEKQALTTVMMGQETILLVDDEKMIIDVGRELLEELGYKVILASSGHEAIAIYRQKCEKIDLIIMDMIMPIMGGGETFDRLKKINPDSKVLLSSGYSVDGQASKILERGCDGFIQKPFNMRQLSIKVREILDSADLENR